MLLNAYNGEQYTPQTGLIYLRARNYDPATGTFTSKDTYMGDKTDPVTRNRYTYGNNNPVAFQDPSGHKGIIKSFAAAVKSKAKAAEAASSAWHNSAIGKSVTAISQSIDKAATAAKEKFENSSIGQFCSKVANSVTSFYEKHKTAINIIVGVAVIALCAVATVATAGGCGIDDATTVQIVSKMIHIMERVIRSIFYQNHLF